MPCLLYDPPVLPSPNSIRLVFMEPLPKTSHACLHKMPSAIILAFEMLPQSSEVDLSITAINIHLSQERTKQNFKNQKVHQMRNAYWFRCVGHLHKPVGQAHEKSVTTVVRSLNMFKSRATDVSSISCLHRVTFLNTLHCHWSSRFLWSSRSLGWWKSPDLDMAYNI